MLLATKCEKFYDRSQLIDAWDYFGKTHIVFIENDDSKGTSLNRYEISETDLVQYL